MHLTIPSSTSLSISQIELLEKAVQYEQSSLAANTRRTYLVMWTKFVKWCQTHQLCPLPATAETISLFLSDLGGKVSFSTIDSVIASIEKTHRQNNVSVIGNLDLYRRIRKGIRRTHVEKQTLKQAKALSVIDLTIFCRHVSNTPQGVRDKAMIILAFFGALRRSELVGLNVEQIEISDKGLTLKLFQTKTSDQMVKVYLAKTKDPSICPVKALKEWLTLSEIKTGPLFRPLTKSGKARITRLTGHAVAEIMKKHFGKEYSGHSLRRGLVTAVAEKGAALHRIQQHSRHKTANMVMKYIEHVEGFEHASAITLST